MGIIRPSLCVQLGTSETAFLIKQRYDYSYAVYIPRQENQKYFIWILIKYGR